jgi:uncharacterized protein
MIVTLIAGLLLGLAGSLHCVGMCGPLSFALPVHHLSAGRKAAALGMYHAGRIFTYAVLGLLFGLAGRKLYLAGMQQTLSVLSGCLMLLFTVQYFVLRQTWQPAFIRKFHIRLQYAMVALLNKNSWTSFISFGAMNALLPCGMVYIAIAGALSTNNVLQGVIFMVGFGLATLPAMLLLQLFGSMLDLRMRNNMKKLTPYFIGIIAMLLILRGLNLGIPFISPVMENLRGHEVHCR